MDFLDPAIDKYAVQSTTSESEVLSKLNRDTNLNVLIPRMLSGHLQGRVLAMLSKMINPRRVLEIGTYTGYSAICLAEGLTENGKLFTIDINEELETMVRGYLAEAGVAKKIDFKIGDAIQIIPELDEQWDLVFIDADKTNYSNYFDLVIDKLRPGGFIIADNVLWSGKVLKDTSSMDDDTQALVNYRNKIVSENRVEQVLFPIRDGLLIARKL